MSKDTIQFQCVRCGSALFEIPSNPKASDTIKCGGCGAQGRYGDIQKEATKKAKAAVEKQLKDTLKKAGFK